jgi:hypothetical protein
MMSSKQKVNHPFTGRTPYHRVTRSVPKDRFLKRAKMKEARELASVVKSGKISQ